MSENVIDIALASPFTGLGVALATPFTTSDHAVDYPAFRRLVRHVAAGGADFLVVLGSTGEAATLVESERDSLVAACLEEAGRLPVVVGTGHNATRQTVSWTRRARQLGASGALVVTPFYNKPTPDGLLAHYQAVAEVGLPIIAYNVPGRTGTNLAPVTLTRLWAIPELVALKESSGNLAQIGEMARTLPRGKVLLSGDDNLALASLATGARGLISVLGNLLPAEMKALTSACQRGDFATARMLHSRLLPLMDALFLESNPIPLKAALTAAGLTDDVLRLPLLPASPRTRDGLREALAVAQVAEVAA